MAMGNSNPSMDLMRAIVAPGYLALSPMTCAALFIAGLGAITNLLAYSSLQPLVIGALFLVSSMFALGLKGLGGHDECRAFLLVYSVTWFWAGIAAAYATVSHDPSQVGYGDAAYFYNLVSDNGISGMSLEAISSLSEGAGSIILWRFMYEMFSSLGFEKGRFIGVTLNVTLVSLSAVIGIKIMKVVFGEDRSRITRFTWVFALCGLFWLFGGIHNRDAAVLFSNSLLILFWIRYLHSMTARNLAQLGVATALAFAAFGFLRTEFFFVPLAMLLAGLAAAIFGQKNGKSHVEAILLAMMLAIPLVGYLLSEYQTDLVYALLSGNENYKMEAMAQSGEGSLGNQLVVNQPLPIRLVAGSLYLFIFPIPFWSGFQLEQAYHLFKSFHALFMFGMTPLFALAILRIIRNKSLRTMPVLFLVFVAVGFTLGTAYTSLETRHLGVFLPALFVIAMLPDISARRDGNAYHNLLLLFFTGIFLIHMAWMVMKFV